MAVKYPVDPVNKLETVESIANRIADTGKEQGIVLVRGVASVAFNLKNGEASPVMQNVSPGVHNIFDFKDEEKVKGAIQLIAMQTLMQRLLTLNDKQINNRIHANHNGRETGELTNLTFERVDATLRQLQRSSMSLTLFAAKPSELQLAVAKAIGRVEEINCIQKVDTIMDVISTAQKQHRPK